MNWSFALESSHHFSWYQLYVLYVFGVISVAKDVVLGRPPSKCNKAGNSWMSERTPAWQQHRMTRQPGRLIDRFSVNQHVATRWPRTPTTTSSVSHCRRTSRFCRQHQTILLRLSTTSIDRGQRVIPSLNHIVATAILVRLFLQVLLRPTVLWELLLLSLQMPTCLLRHLQVHFHRTFQRSGRIRIRFHVWIKVLIQQHVQHLSLQIENR